MEYLKYQNILTLSKIANKINIKRIVFKKDLWWLYKSLIIKKTVE